MQQHRLSCSGLATNKHVMSITVIQLCMHLLDLETCVSLLWECADCCHTIKQDRTPQEATQDCM